MKGFFIMIAIMHLTVGLLAQNALAPSIGDGSASNPYQISLWENLYWISQNPSQWNKNYLQTENIDFNTANPAISGWNNNTGWMPIGNTVNPFTGFYDGNDKIIMGLYINRSSSDTQALFGNIQTGAVIKNLGVTDADVKAHLNSGGLAGINLGTITNCYTSGSIEGFGGVGLIVGVNFGMIENCHNIGTVNSSSYCAGGVVGLNNNPGTITQCYNTGNVNGHENSGGVVGENYSFISQCFNTGNVTGFYHTGGLVGWEENANHQNSYSKGNVTGESFTGGLVGGNYLCQISNSYSTGLVIGTTYTGGLLGGVDDGDPGITNCFWDNESSGQTTSGGGVGKSTSEMKILSTYTEAGWNFQDVWNINASHNEGYPYLIFPNNVDIDDVVINSPTSHNITLFSAYPNPFNPSTTISFEIRNNEQISIDVFNTKGQLVKNLVNKNYQTGKHSVIWDGKDLNGKQVGSGVYFYRLMANNHSSTNKIILLK